MASNPYAGTNYEQSWQQGFCAAVLQPFQNNPAPSPLAPDQQTVYSEGVLAGQDAANGLSAPPVPPPPESGWGELAVEGSHTLADLIHTGYEIKQGAAVAGSVGAFLLTGFVSIAVFGPEQLPYFDEAAAQAMNRVRLQLQQAGISDSIDLYMAACSRTDHDANVGTDELTQQGWWHGLVYLSFDQAYAEAAAHEHPGNVRIVHLQTASPDTIELIDLPGASC